MKLALEVRIPGDDPPKVWSLALVAMVALGAGVGLSAWAAGSSESSREHARESGAEDGPRDQERTDPESEPSTEDGARDEDRSDRESEPVAQQAEGESPSASPSGDDEAPSEPVVEADEPEEAGEGPPEETDAPRQDSASGLSENDAVRHTALEPAVGPSDAARRAGLSFRQGTVAYLRCDGVERRGRFPCPRDEVLEAAVWPLIQAVTACPTGPDRAGEADVRLDYRADGAPEIRWRDTFPDDTVRLDRERVLGCLRGPLEATRQSLGAERLLMSFRFALVSP